MNIEEKEEDDNKNDAEYEAEILTEASTVRDDGDTAKEWVRTTLGEDNIRMTALKRKFGRKFPRWIKVCAADISTQFGDFRSSIPLYITWDDLLGRLLSLDAIHSQAIFRESSQRFNVDLFRYPNLFPCGYLKEAFLQTLIKLILFKYFPPLSEKSRYYVVCIEQEELRRDALMNKERNERCKPDEIVHKLSSQHSIAHAEGSTPSNSTQETRYNYPSFFSNQTYIQSFILGRRSCQIVGHKPAENS
ncbi:hypothetical protein T310_9723 [Rasamsonia emersonii CBS 393.64]|uniref:Uncharacterized protein n=1 Tax=Rasamsonia emersonii (strain ATCC 16479 / CBS 393.64 / IMI 116815) TaxID=1408163 RepID=A0A0F4YEW3_RASE3|nr:hypothetical protein T310_9723 [Rasamsonia emersonii CBS 393.64]KKA16675.1 hypothetical protein T310_9723 [Rasamsonia emersonii CBS 393.64]